MDRWITIVSFFGMANFQRQTVSFREGIWMEVPSKVSFGMLFPITIGPMAISFNTTFQPFTAWVFVGWSWIHLDVTPGRCVWWRAARCGVEKWWKKTLQIWWMFTQKVWKLWWRMGIEPPHPGCQSQMKGYGIPYWPWTCNNSWWWLLLGGG